MTEANSELWTERQAADYLGITPRTLRQWRNTRGVPHIRLTGKIVRYRMSDLQNWIDQYRVQVRTFPKTAPQS